MLYLWNKYIVNTCYLSRLARASRSIAVSCFLLLLLAPLQSSAFFRGTSADTYETCLEDGFSTYYCSEKYDEQRSTFTTQTAELKTIHEEGYLLDTVYVTFNVTDKRLLQEFSTDRTDPAIFSEKLARIAENTNAPTSQINAYMSDAIGLYQVESIRQVDDGYLITVDGPRSLLDFKQDLEALEEVSEVSFVSERLPTMKTQSLKDDAQEKPLSFWQQTWERIRHTVLGWFGISLDSTSSSPVFYTQQTLTTDTSDEWTTDKDPTKDGTGSTIGTDGETEIDEKSVGDKKDNECEGCGYVCMPTVSASIAGTQRCREPADSSEECGGDPCKGVCEGNNTFCTSDADCTGSCLPMNALNLEKPTSCPLSCLDKTTNEEDEGPTCGDGICEDDEKESCPADCDGGEDEGPTCGDGICEDDEKESCPVDCDDGGETTEVCGDNICEGDETVESCPEDCDDDADDETACGDGLCEGIESPINCPEDCEESGGDGDGDGDGDGGNESDGDGDDTECVPSGVERDNCSDGIDNDCDGNIDCEDTACAHQDVCEHGSADGCGDGQVETEAGEACDDGNLESGDGCDASCEVEEGWRCNDAEPSQCGQLSCTSHGSTYSEADIYGRCCAGLDEHMIEDDGEEVTLCYDPAIDEPLCLTNEQPEGRYLKDMQDDSIELAYEASCEDTYNDYAQEIMALLDEKHAYCQFDDENYDEVNFNDIERSRERTAILALRHFCVVKGRGPALTSYDPESRVSRGEFIKMLYKTYAVGKDIELLPEGETYEGDTYYTDVASHHRSAQYVAAAYELGWLQPLETSTVLNRFIYPNKSVKLDEVKNMLDRVDEGAVLEPATVEQILGDSTYPDRASIAKLLTRMFLDKFIDYFYMQDGNKELYQDMVDDIEDLTYSEQYDYILDEIDRLEEADHEELLFEEGVDAFWAVSFLKKILKGVSVVVEGVFTVG